MSLQFYKNLFPEGKPKPEMFDLSIRDIDGDVSNQRYFRMWWFMKNHGANMYNMCTYLAGDTRDTIYILSMYDDFISLCVRDMVTGQGTIWEFAKPSSWEFAEHKSATPFAPMTESEFVSEFYEFVDDYSEN